MMSLIKTIRAYLSVSGHVFVVFFNLLYGIWRLSRLKQSPVTIFGGTHLPADSIFIKKAQTLARLLAADHIPVLTGGGPGIMEAANCGAFSERKNIITTIGIGVKGLDREAGFNKCARYNITMRDFSSRKLLLTSYSIGFAIFPGGFGTLDELTELLTLIQTNIRKRAPIVLVGVAYWRPFMQWVHQSALANGLVTKEDVALFSITDDVEKAFNILRIHKKPFSVLTDI